MPKLEIKTKTVSGQWGDMAIEEFAGKTFGEMFAGWEGREVVALVHYGADKPGVVAGTEKWVEYYKGRQYHVMTFAALIEKLKANGRQDVLDTCPLPGDLLHALVETGLAGGVVGTEWPDAVAEEQGIGQETTSGVGRWREPDPGLKVGKRPVRFGTKNVL